MIVVIPTQKTESEYLSSLHGKCLVAAQQGYEHIEKETYVPNSKFQIVVFGKNSKGLSELYNSVLSEHKEEDIVVFMHDDVEIHDQFFAEKLKKAHQYFDIVGLAGATQQTYHKGRNHLWHISTDAKDLRGFVSHYFPQGYYNSSFFGKTPEGVSVIDGLFMSIKVSSLKDNFDLFDEDFTFHHYDLAMGRKAMIKGLKLGVWPIFVIHHGLGEFNTPEWYDSNKKFDEKYAKLT